MSKLGIVLIVVILAIGGIGAYFFMSGGEGGTSGESSLFEKVYFEGAYLKYEVNAYHPLQGNLKGELTATITDITKNNYTQIKEASGDVSAVLKPETETKDINEALTKPEAVKLGEFIGTETINTEIGTMELAHYRFENQVEGGLENTDMWIEKETNMMMKMFVKYPAGSSLNIGIIDTNINYFKEKAQ